MPDDCNRDALFDELSQPHMSYLRKAGIIDHNGEFILRSEKERAPATPAEKAVDLRNHAAEFATKLLVELPRSDLPKYVAPGRYPTGKHGPWPMFRARYPKFDPERHQKYLDAGHRGVNRVAASEHRSAQYASQMRCEILLTALVSGQPVPFAIASPRVKFPPDDEMPLACGVFPILWEAHESALAEAETRFLRNGGTTRPLLSSRGRLLYDLFRLMTQLKIDNSVTTYNKMFKALGPILDACRADLEQR